MKDNIQIGLVGLGGRGYGVLEAELMRMTDITITGVCDLYEDRVKKAADFVAKAIRLSSQMKIPPTDGVSFEPLLGELSCEPVL